MDDLHDNERVDDLKVGGLKLIQAVDGYRFSLDPILLVDFASVRSGDRVVDLGTASGIIPLLLAGKLRDVAIVGLELQTSLCQRAQRNVVMNRLADRIEIRQMDVRKIADGCGLSAGSFDRVLMNPPYRTAGSGRYASGDERAACRHELSGGIEEFLRAASWLLRSGGGVNVVFLAERLSELMRKMVDTGIEPKRMRLVHSTCQQDAHLALVEGRKGGRPGLVVERPLNIYEQDRYSQEIQALFDS